MENQTQEVASVSDAELSYLDLQAYIGTTKHMGGLETTRELGELCHIGTDTRVLDIGCGVGATACYLAKHYGCRVIGVDVREAMIVGANERAQRQRVSDRVEFKVADAQDLALEDALFDVVICESVATFIEDKRKVILELARVTRPGGRVGLNEQLWLKTPPTEITERIKRLWDIEPDIPTLDEWVRLLEAARLKDIIARVYKFDSRRESSQVWRYELRDFLCMAYRMLLLSLRNPAFRKRMREIRRFPKEMFDYLGYAVFVGEK